MNTLMTDPALTDATIVAVSMTPLPPRADHDLELAAHVCRVREGRLEEIGGAAYARIPAKRTSDHEIARRSGLDVQQVAGMPAPAIALAYLNMHLTQPPYVIVVHQAPNLIDVLDRYRYQCPYLAEADLVDTAELAYRLHEIPPAVPLAACARTLGVHEGLPDAVGAAARLTAAVFARLALVEDPGVGSLAELVDVAGRPGLQAVAA